MVIHLGFRSPWTSSSLPEIILQRRRERAAPGMLAAPAVLHPCLTLLPEGVTWPRALLPAPVVSYTTFSPLPPRQCRVGGMSLWSDPSGCPDPDLLRLRALGSADFPLKPPPARKLQRPSSQPGVRSSYHKTRARKKLVLVAALLRSAALIVQSSFVIYEPPAAMYVTSGWTTSSTGSTSTSSYCRLPKPSSWLYSSTLYGSL